jgi:release factor glutamine methyltransferase
VPTGRQGDAATGRIRDSLEAADRLAKSAGAEATPWDARVLLAHAIGERNPLGLDPERELTQAESTRFSELWDRRLSGTPVQHLIGEWDFHGRTFAVDGRALVPRPETEILVEAALREAPHARNILDAGTGCGIVAASLLCERRQTRAVALDISLEALALARDNRDRHGLGSRMLLVASDWLSALAPRAFDCAVSNPPYLPVSSRESLPRTVRDHDPSAALYAGQDGLAAIRHLLDTLPAHLAPGAPFLFEIGQGQAEAVEGEIRRRPAWEFGAIEPDLAGMPRVAIARRRRGALSSEGRREDR